MCVEVTLRMKREGGGGKVTGMEGAKEKGKVRERGENKTTLIIHSLNRQAVARPSSPAAATVGSCVAPKTFFSPLAASPPQD